MKALAAAALVLAVLVAAGCGGSDEKTTTTAPPVTTQAAAPPSPEALEFRRHVEAAVRALRTGIQQPLENGDFEGSVTDALSAVATAGSAVVTATRELSAAVSVATSEGGLPELATQAKDVIAKLPKLVSGAQDGSLDTQDLATFLDELDALGDTVTSATPDLSTTTTTP